MVNSHEFIFKYLPLNLSEILNRLPEETLSSVNEIRLRKGMPLSLTSGDKNLFVSRQGLPCKIENAVRATQGDIDECISRLTRNSLYTCDEYMARGFIPLPEGGRAGVCGQAIYRKGVLKGFSEIYSLNLRLHRFLPNIALPLAELYKEQGIQGCLVCSPPALGKTSFLRSAAYLLSRGRVIPPLRVAVADEKCEIFSGMPKEGLLDIISGVPKAEAISLLTCTMAPEIIVCDEISPQEVPFVLEAQNTGVCFLASAHCENPKELLKRGAMKQLLESEIFPLCAILGYEQGYTLQIAKTKELL